MHGIHRPGGDTGQQRVGDGDAAVAAIRRIEVLEAFFSHRDAGGRERPLPHHQRHLRRIGCQRRQLRVQPAAQRHRLVQHGLRRRAPLVDRALRVRLVPEVEPAQCRHVVVGEFLPGGGVRRPDAGSSNDACSWMKPGRPAITLRAPRLSKSEPSAATVLPNVSSPDSACMGDQEPPLGVPSISSRAPSRAIMRFQVAGLSSCMVRATSPPIECASSRTGRPLVSRAASAASTAAASRRASSSIGRRQS